MTPTMREADLRKGRLPQPVSCRFWSKGPRRAACRLGRFGLERCACSTREGAIIGRWLLGRCAVGRRSSTSRKLRPIFPLAGSRTSWRFREAISLISRPCLSERFALTHLVAVSGSHFAYIAAMLERALRHVGLSKGAQQLVMLLVMAAYMVFTGGAPSAIRSVCMVAIASAAIMCHRRAHAPSGLAIAVAALVAVDPGAVYDLGFRLSVASVLFIIMFGPNVRHHLCALHLAIAVAALVAVDPGAVYDLGFRLSVASVLFIILVGPYVRHHLCALHVPAPIADALSITLVAQWATLPLTLPVFGEVSLVSPLANLLIGCPLRWWPNGPRCR